MWDTFPRDVIEACLFADPDGSSETLAEADALPTLESAPHDGSGDSLDRSSPPDEPASLASPPARAAARADPALADPDGSSETLAEADALPTLESAPHDGSGDSLDRSSPPDEPASLASPPARAAARADPAQPRNARLAARGTKRKAKAHNHAPANGAPERRCRVHGCDAVCGPGYLSKNRVCREHARACSVQLSACGSPMRFCTRCTTFHTLGDFSNGFRVCAAQLRADARRRAARSSSRVSRVGSRSDEEVSAMELEMLEDQIQAEVDERRKARVGNSEAFHAGSQPGLRPGLGPGLGSGMGHGLNLGFPQPAPSRYFRFFAPPIESVRSQDHHASICASIFSRFSAGRTSSNSWASGALGAMLPSPSLPLSHASQYVRVHPDETFTPAYGRMNPHPRASDDSFSVSLDQHAARQEMQTLTAMEPPGNPRTWPETFFLGGHEAPSAFSGEEEIYQPVQPSNAISHCFVGFSHGPSHATKVDGPDEHEDALSGFLRDDGTPNPTRPQY